LHIKALGVLASKACFLIDYICSIAQTIQQRLDCALISEKLTIRRLILSQTSNQHVSQPIICYIVNTMKKTVSTLLNRDLSILSFNERVLSLAQREDYPLLERLRFLCIVASNLDEFFEVRMADQLEAIQNGISNANFNAETYEAISQKAHALVAKQYHLFEHELMPALEKQGVSLVSSHLRTPEQKKWVAQYFQADVKPLLLPIALDPSHPFPQVANKALHFIVQLESKAKPTPSIAIVRVPRVLPRVTKLPSRLSKKQQCFVSLTSIIRAHLPDLFQGAKIINFSQFRVTRNSDLDVEDDVSNLRTALREELAFRPYGEPVRLEVTIDCDESLSTFLLEQFALPPSALYKVNGPVNLGRLIQLPDLAGDAKLLFPTFTPAWPKGLAANKSMFSQLKKRDVLIHQPFESFEAVIQLLQEAVHDPDVLAIHQTIYRAGSDPRILNLLQTAVQRGKEVLVVVELKARFDEEANINWAEALESIGAQVVYGIVGLKTHAKMLLIMRREGRAIKRYAHVSTGNYNPKTAKLYTDLSMLTSDLTITREIEQLFRHLTSELPLPKMRKLLASPFTLHSTMLRYINAAGNAAAKGKTAKIIIKTNSLTDEALVLALMRAAKKGATIDLIVRSACILPPGAKDLHDRIHVRSIVGRFLEHSRAFYFDIDGKVKLWLASADWMSRNMLRRVEIAWPILDTDMQKRIMDECFTPYLQDNVDAWALTNDGSYQLVRNTDSSELTTPTSAQTILLQKNR
jgi:polyphosphate kinase